MTAARNRPPAGQPWIWLTRDLLASDAWRSMTGPVRRFVDFVLLEHMRRGGRHNGELLAPHRQLEAFGIGTHQVAGAILAADALGLVDVFRGGMRVATRYAIGWLPLHDGTPAADRWRLYRNPSLPPIPAPRSRNLPAKQQAELPAKQRADCQNLPAKQRADTPRNLPAKQQALLRSSYQGGARDSVGAIAGRAAPPRKLLPTPSAQPETPSQPQHAGTLNGHRLPEDAKPMTASQRRRTELQL